MTTWVLRWRWVRGIERPVVEPAKGDDLRCGLGRATKREAIESTLRHIQRNLENARQSVLANEKYVEQLEQLLAKEEPVK